MADCCAFCGGAQSSRAISISKDILQIGISYYMISTVAAGCIHHFLNFSRFFAVSQPSHLHIEFFHCRHDVGITYV